jgi:hypothetical protein
MKQRHIGMVAAAAGLLSTAAAAVQVQVQCQNQVVDGVTVCAVDMSSYATDPVNGQPVCPAGVTSTGSSLICEESFAAAVHDAVVYFKQNTTGPKTYYIAIDPGSYDFSSETHLHGEKGAIEVSNIAPQGNGCLTPDSSTTGTVALLGDGCLVISGTSSAATTLVVPNSVPTIHGIGSSHVMIANLTMQQALIATTQGTFVSSGSHEFGGVAFPTVTLDISPGFPSPLDLFILNCGGTPPNACTRHGIVAASDDIYMRAYTNEATPQLIPSVSKKDLNAQFPFGFPSVGHKRIAVVPPFQPDPTNYPNRWEITVSVPHALPSAYSGTTNGVANLVCMKVDHADAFWFGGAGGGTDIIMSGMNWIGASRGEFRRISASAESGTPGAQVYNSSISRAAPINGQVPCLASQSGGMQFGQPGDPPIYGNIVYGLQAEATGDDAIAMFNDVGGQPDGNGGTYPQTVIRNSALGNAFARDIYLYNDKHFSHFPGNSPVLVDDATQNYINAYGNCDPIVVGDGNCPVTYQSN